MQTNPRVPRLCTLDLAPRACRRPKAVLPAVRYAASAPFTR
eukprot:CAMPEP_0204342692 /NCGR_PEP_ID=MMETSP0469-20131031/24332_1 /ASSEMBLY_ACC=CAM_ASM_000384 /TAXON_ID=2969 /ORGANISM="Oxyrrhis marina" /LENGTH=40 /DNA_ID= /DNA_START= /DNA_END= /DNA_ORIENTATION=